MRIYSNSGTHSVYSGKKNVLLLDHVTCLDTHFSTIYACMEQFFARMPFWQCINTAVPSLHARYVMEENAPTCEKVLAIMFFVLKHMYNPQPCFLNKVKDH